MKVRRRQAGTSLCKENSARKGKGVLMQNLARPRAPSAGELQGKARQQGIPGGGISSLIAKPSHVFNTPSLRPGATAAMSASIFGGSMRLRDLIRAVRNCKTAAEERALIAKESASLRTEFRDQARAADCPRGTGVHSRQGCSPLCRMLRCGRVAWRS